MDEPLLPTLHSRARRTNRYVYVVRSRRSGGLSIGINLDPQKTCNFDCVYCEVIDRRDVMKGKGRPALDEDALLDELDAELVLFDPLASDEGTLRDIAFAGDGEPSTYPGFLALSEKILDLRDLRGFRVPLVLITNGSGLDRQEMRRAQDLFAARGGTFWIKLDAGTEAFYRAVCRTSIPLERILSNLTEAARRHPVVMQSMFFRWNDAPPTREEIAAYAARLAEIVAKGGRISLVQVYTVARETMEPGVTPLSEDELGAIAETARRAVPGVPVAAFA